MKDESHRFVWVERQLLDGARTLERMTAIEAAIEAIAGAQNGVTVRSLIVGGAMCWTGGHGAREG